MNYTSVYPLNLSRLLSLCGTRVSAEHLQIKKNAKYHHSKAFPSCSLTPQSVTTVLQADQTNKARIISQWTRRAPLPCWEGNHWTGPIVEKGTMTSILEEELRRGEVMRHLPPPLYTTAQVYLCTHLAPCCIKKPRFLSSSWWLQKLILRKETLVSFMPLKDQHSTSG